MLQSVAPMQRTNNQRGRLQSGQKVSVVIRSQKKNDFLLKNVFILNLN